VIYVVFGWEEEEKEEEEEEATSSTFCNFLSLIM